MALGGCPYKEPCNGRLTEDGEDIAMAKGGVVPGVFFFGAGSLRTRLPWWAANVNVIDLYIPSLKQRAKAPKTKMDTKNYDLEKVTPFKYIARVGIYVRFLGCSS